jgi:hypothetical protein
MSAKLGLAVAAAPVVGTILVVLTMRSVTVFDWLTRENSLFESLQVATLVVSTALFVWIGVHLVRRRRPALGSLYLLLGLGAFMIAGEETSWGQTLFRWEASGWLAQRNFQGETNFHTGIAHGPTVYGFIVIGAYGTFASLLAGGRREHRTPARYLLLPPLVLVPAFAIPFGYRLIRIAFNPEERFPRYALQLVEFAEYAELTMYFGILVLALLTWRLYIRRPSGRLRFEGGPTS